ncbi:MAG: hypothetical protein ACRECL_10835 [Bradyrhizobium sp.]
MVKFDLAREAKTRVVPRRQRLASLEIVCLALAFSLAALLLRIVSIW